MHLFTHTCTRTQAQAQAHTHKKHISIILLEELRSERRPAQRQSSLQHIHSLRHVQHIYQLRSKRRPAQKHSSSHAQGQAEICAAIYDSSMRTIQSAVGPSESVHARAHTHTHTQHVCMVCVYKVKRAAAAAVDRASAHDINTDAAAAAWIYRRG